ncbi:MAG: XTP/dITP diphosphatase [Dehalococcoidia bacterium]|nr:MAG: XTP/dITP diphosphatase [Dehalococcoidia bacterium]
METSLRVLVASANRGKVSEYRMLLDGLDCELLSLDDAGISAEIEETGSTYEENARLKAVECAARSGLLTLADDSGLEVDALGGEPGVHSARYAGMQVTDGQRVEYLLKKLDGVPAERRGARFVCVIAIATPEGEVTFCRGECPGSIVMEPRGGKGFGYDPAFMLPELGLTMAELSPDVKNRLSHRGRAAAEARKVLRQFIDGGRAR